MEYASRATKRVLYASPVAFGLFFGSQRAALSRSTCEWILCFSSRRRAFLSAAVSCFTIGVSWSFGTKASLNLATPSRGRGGRFSIGGFHSSGGRGANNASKAGGIKWAIFESVLRSLTYCVAAALGRLQLTKIASTR